MGEQETQECEVNEPRCKTGKGKKILGGCGCGCLVVVLILGGLLYWGYRHFTAFVRGYEEQGYALIQGQVITSPTDRTGDFVFFGQQVTVGNVNGNVAAMCQQITFDGTVTGDLNLFSQQVIIGKTAVIEGDIHSEGVHQLTVHGKVLGEITGTIQQLIDPNQKQE